MVRMAILSCVQSTHTRAHSQQTIYAFCGCAILNFFSIWASFHSSQLCLAAHNNPPTTMNHPPPPPWSWLPQNTDIVRSKVRKIKTNYQRTNDSSKNSNNLYLIHSWENEAKKKNKTQKKKIAIILIWKSLQNVPLTWFSFFISPSILKL